MISAVRFSKQAEKDLMKVPIYIGMRLRSWIASVEVDGLYEVRKRPGFHDEPLKGPRVGQRSIRLNKAYRAIYLIQDDGIIEFVQILEVNKHDY